MINLLKIFKKNTKKFNDYSILRKQNIYKKKYYIKYILYLFIFLSFVYIIFILDYRNIKGKLIFNDINLNLSNINILYNDGSEIEENIKINFYEKLQKFYKNPNFNNLELAEFLYKNSSNFKILIVKSNHDKLNIILSPVKGIMKIGDNLLLDENAVIYDNSGNKNLPILTGLEKKDMFYNSIIKESVDLFLILRNNNLNIKKMEFKKLEGFSFTLKNGLDIEIGRKPFKRKIKNFLKLNIKDDTKISKINLIDNNKVLTK